MQYITVEVCPDLKEHFKRLLLTTGISSFSPRKWLGPLLMWQFFSVWYGNHRYDQNAYRYYLPGVCFYVNC